MTRSRLTRSFATTLRTNNVSPARRDNDRIPTLATLSTRSEQILNDSCPSVPRGSTLMENVSLRKEFNTVSELANFPTFENWLSTIGDVHLLWVMTDWGQRQHTLSTRTVCFLRFSCLIYISIHTRENRKTHSLEELE